MEPQDADNREKIARVQEKANNEPFVEILSRKMTVESHKRLTVGSLPTDADPAMNGRFLNHEHLTGE